MNIRRNLTLVCAALLVAITASAPVAQANLLVDPGYETNPVVSLGLVLGFFSTFQGQWGVEVATITGVDGGVTPAAGNRMLRMADDGLIATQAVQVTDVTSYAALIDSGGATVNLSALFNADSNVPAAVGSVVVSFFSAANNGSGIGSPSSAALTLDGTPSTWEALSTSGAIPIGTRWLSSQVAYNNASLLGNPGYVDAADLTIVPEPATLSLLVLGGLAVLRRRSR